MTDLSELEALVGRATPGPYYLHDTAIGVNPWISAKGGECSDGDYSRGGCILNMVAHDRRREDAALITAALNALPHLLSTIRSQEAALVELRAENERLKAEDADCYDLIGKYALEVARLNAALVEAREALEPFAIAWTFEKDAPDDEVRCSTATGMHAVSVEAFRRAASALSKLEGGE